MGNIKWSKEQTQTLMVKVLRFQKQGLSIRKACERIAGQDIDLAIKFENKFKYFKKKNKLFFIKMRREIFENEGISKENVISFRKTKSKANKNSKAQLSDNEIKSLFMGLVKLVKKSAISEYSSSVQEKNGFCDKNLKLALVKVEEQKRKNVFLEEENKELNLKVTKLKLKLEQMRCSLKINKSKR